MRFWAGLWGGLALTALALGWPAGAAAGGQGRYLMPEANELAAFVDRAAALVARRGQAAFDEMNQCPGPWCGPDSGRYVFVRDAQGVQRVNGMFPDMLGRRTTKANKRAAYFDQVLLGGRRPAVWSHTLWKNPATGRSAWKSSYKRLAVAPDGRRYIVGAGSHDLMVERAFVEELVGLAVEELAMRGRDALPLLGDPDGPFRFRDLYIFITDADCVELFNPAFPDLRGTDIGDLKDEFGNFFVRQYVARALEHGQGWTEYHWPRPGRTKPELKYTYTQKATLDGKPVAVGMGMYLDYPPREMRRVVEAKTKLLARSLAGLSARQQRQAAAALRQFLEVNPELAGVAWATAPFDRAGRRLVDVHKVYLSGARIIEDNAVDLPWAEAGWLHRAAETGRPAWSKARYARRGDGPPVKLESYAVPVLDAQGGLKALAVGDMRLRADQATRARQLAQASEAIAKEIHDILRGLDKACAAVCRHDVDTPETLAALGRLYNRKPYFFSAVTVDGDNVLRAVAPAQFGGAVGRRTGDPAGAEEVRASGRPLLSKPFTMAEGFVGSALGQPAPCPDGGPQGAEVSVTFNPTDMAARALPRHLTDSIMVLRAQDGFFVYSPRQTDINRSVLADPKFARSHPGLAALGRRITAEAHGAAHYEGVDGRGRPVRRMCLWNTVPVAGQQWRVALFWDR